MAKKDAKSNKDKKQKHFFKDFKAEIKKVIWPTPKQLVNSTVAIIVMVLVVAVIVFVLDIAFEAFNKYALTNMQETVQSISAEDEQESTNTDSTSVDEGTTDGSATDDSAQSSENAEATTDEANSEESTEDQAENVESNE